MNTFIVVTGVIVFVVVVGLAWLAGFESGKLAGRKEIYDALVFRKEVE
jgi:uncharacterized membrane protein (DUF485 family)